MATSSGDRQDELQRVSRELADCFERGEEPALADWQRRHPDLADDLHRLFENTVRLRGKRPVPNTDTWLSAPNPGMALRQVGDYAIVREIGRGGMGVVYEAEQRSLGRRVALKVLPFHVAQDQQALDRFRREARSAAQLHHTNIVPVFEVGQEGAVCYYVMQFIEGRSLAQDVLHLRQEPLPFPDHQRRVARLGEHVAHALAYAHARGIVHRDIKPSNLLVDDSGTVWVTDFGLAKGSGDNLTMTGDIVGTLGFMAPERFGGHCDHRADIYALGLTLYEVLLLRPAYPPSDHARLMEMVQRSEPPQPRSVDVRVARDLETIILKAIDKDPARRYQTAAALAEDLRRFLADEPIAARPVGAVEKAVRAARRNPRLAALLALVAVLVVTLIAGAIVAALTFSQKTELARLAEENADDKAREASELSTFLLGLFEGADPATLVRRGATARKLDDRHLSPLEMFNRAAERLKTAFKDRPALRADLLAKVGVVYVSFGQFGRAKPLLDEALAERQQLFQGDHLDLAESWQHLGYWHQAQYNRSEAAQAYDKALAIRSKLLAADDPRLAETLTHLGFVKAEMPETSDGEAMLARARDIQAKHFGEESREHGIALLAQFQYHFHRKDKVKLLLLAHETDKLARRFGENSKVVAALHNFIQGQIEKRLASPNYARAAEKFEKALELAEPLIGKTHFFAMLGRKDLAFLYLEELNRPDEAAKQFRISYERLLSMNEEESSEAAYILMHLGRCLEAQHNLKEAERVLRQAVGILRKEQGDLGRTLHCLADVLAKDKRWLEAEPVLAEAVQVRKANPPEDRWGYSNALDLYVAVLSRHGKTDQVIAALREHLAALDAHTKADANFHFHQAVRRGHLCVLWAGAPAEERQAELAKAMTSLRQAVQAGFRDTDALKTHPHLAPLRALPEFASLVEKM